MELFYHCIVTFISIWLLYRWVRKKRLPPGPPSLPMLGCRPFVPIKPSLKLFLGDEMYMKYGDIVRFDIGFGKSIYVLNDFHQVKIYQFPTYLMQALKD